MDFSSIMVAIATSFIASIVFYFFFEFIPKRVKHHKIRPRIEVELMEISEQLFFLIECPLRHSGHSPSFFQDEIREDRINLSDYELGLYNKCLNQTYLYDENANKMMVVGDSMKKQSNQIEHSIQRVLMNQDYLSAEEILILEDIVRLLHTYSYDTDAVVSIGEAKLYPVNPTISYMWKNFYELYKLYREIRKRQYNFKEIRCEKRQGKERFYRLQWEYTLYLIGKKDYDAAKKKIRYLLKKYDSSSVKMEMNALLLRINVENNQVELAKENLKALLNTPDQLELVYQRSYLQCIRDNNELMMFCESCRSSDEINEWNETVLLERKTKEDFLDQNKKLKHYYEKKTETPQANAKHS